MRLVQASLTLLVAALSGACKQPCAPPEGGYERGCILLDGYGYRYLADAVSVAEDGQTIHLCGGIVSESVTIDKNIILAGHGTVLRPPANEPALVVAPGISFTLRNTQIRSTRNGITIQDGARVTLYKVEIQNSGSYGIEATHAVLHASRTTIENTLWGGIRMLGGELELTDVTFEDCSGYGVRLEDDAIASILDSHIGRTYVSGASGSQDDGWGVSLEGGEAVIRDTVFEANTIGAVEVVNGTLDVQDCTHTNDYIGYWLENSDVHLSHVTSEGIRKYGIVSQNTQLVMEHGTLLGDPETSPVEDATSSLVGGYGMIGRNGAITLTDVEISGHNGGGLHISSTNPQSNMPLVLDDVVISDNQTQGLLLRRVDAEFTDVDVLGTRNDDPLCVEGASYSCNWGMGAFNSNVDWVGGTLRGSGDIGLHLDQSAGLLQEVAISDNAHWGVWVLEGALTLLDSSVSGTGEIAVHLEDAYGLIRSTVFDARNHTLEVDASTFVYHFLDEGVDIHAHANSNLVVEDSQFLDGDRAILVTSADATLRNTHIEGYRQAAVDVYGGEISIDRGTLRENAGHNLTCAGDGRMNLSDSTLADNGVVHTRTEVWQAGEMVSSSTDDQTEALIDGLLCSVDLEDTLLDGTPTQALKLVDTNATFDGVVVRRTGLQPPDDDPTPQGAIVATFTTRPTHLWLYDTSVTGVGAGSALVISGWPEDTSPSVTLRALDIGRDDGEGASGVAENGLVLTDIGHLTMADFDLAPVTGHGIVATRITGTIDGTEQAPGFTGRIDTPGLDGLSAEDSFLEISDLVISDAADAGLRFSGGSVSLVRVESSGTNYGLTCPAEAPPDPWSCTQSSIASISGCGSCTP